MGGFTVDEDEEAAAAGRENGDFLAGSHVQAKHRRSKSATEKKLYNPRGGVTQSVPNGFNESHELPPSGRSCGARSPLYKYSNTTKTDDASIHRASLEEDIEQLQLRLHQEKSMRMMLERAMGRASSTLSPGHRHFAAPVNIVNAILLQKDGYFDYHRNVFIEIIQLTLTKELIAEIELLEEEVANREQHVLSLYRSIFEQCVSRPPSVQSSSMTSPAHTKYESRKHPTIISSTFCSSKNFPLRPFQALASIHDSGKRTLHSQPKRRHATMLSGKAINTIEKTWSDHGKGKEMLPTLERTSVLRTLKDHLYQCPSKLSEEMVRCMASVYCWLRSSASVNLEQNRSPLLSRSSTNVVLPRRGISEDIEWSCKSMVEISSVSTDKKNFSCASYAISNYRVLVEQLERVNVNQMETNGKIAFWINTYNSLVMHAYLAYGIPHRSLRRLALFHKAAYNISGNIVSANTIEQSIFSFRTPRIGRWLEIILSTAIRKRSVEERQVISSKFSLPKSLPHVCFALCTGAFSDPVLKVYTASHIEEELEVAKREFLRANVVVKKSKKVFLPKVLERYGKEASISSDDLIKWVAKNVDKKLHDSIQKCVDCKSNRKPSQVIEWLPYNSRFRYVFSKDLAEKQWWL